MCYFASLLYSVIAVTDIDIAVNCNLEALPSVRIWINQKWWSVFMS